MPIKSAIYNQSPTPKNIHVAVLYSHTDREHWEGLSKQFRGLTARYRNVRIWSADDVELGGEVSRATKEELKRADITLLLLSPDFINDQIVDSEARFLLETYARFSHSEEYRKQERFIVPVLLNHLYGWEDLYDDHYDIEKLRVFDNLLSSNVNREEAYVRIAKSLEDYIERINAKAINIVLPTWIGFIPGIMYNGGFARNPDTPLFKRYKRNIHFTLDDELDQVCDAFKSGQANMIWATIDRLPYVVDKLQALHPKVIYQASWSDGADAILAREPIRTIQDLRGKKVFFPIDSPSQTFLNYVLKEHGLSRSDVLMRPQRHANLDQLVKNFISDQTADALVIWSPFVEACLDEAPGVNMLAHSGQYPNLIADVLIASKEYINLNREEIVEMLHGWLQEVERFAQDPAYQEKAVDVLIDAIIKPLPAIIPSTIRGSLIESLHHYFESSLAKVHLCSLDDNRRFFGLPPYADKNTGEALYNRFLTQEYPHLAHLPALQWLNLADASLL
jgi:hypothetical protein